MSDDHRRFQRLPLPDKTVVLDEAGHPLGRLTLAGGGGIQIEDLTEDGKRVLQAGSRVRITIVEPAIAARHTVDIEVRYQLGNRVGAQFVSSTTP